jgi:hypothetical protein
MSDENQVDEQDNNRRIDRRTVYQELCNSYRAIDDFRAKLLGFLPLATGTGMFLLLNNAGFKDFKTLPDEMKSLLVAAGAFGFAITLGLFFYELYGIKKCHALINAGEALETELGFDGQDGQFTKRPREVAGLINEPFAAGVIYPAVLAAWTFFAVFSMPQKVPLWAPRDDPLWAIGVFIVGFTISLFFNLWLKLKLEEKIKWWLNHLWSLSLGKWSFTLKLKKKIGRWRQLVRKWLQLEEKPNISAGLVKLLDIISPNSQMGLRDQEDMKELKDRMNQLGLENRDPSKQDWQDLSELAERLHQAHAKRGAVQPRIAADPNRYAGG